MASTYTPKLNLAKPANGDVDWHIPINGNWDELDSKLGPLYENFTDGASAITLNKSIDANSKDITGADNVSANNFTSPNVMLSPFYTDTMPPSVLKTITGTTPDDTTTLLGTITVPSQYVVGSLIGYRGSITATQYGSYTVGGNLYIKVNGNLEVSKQIWIWGTTGKTVTESFKDTLSIKGDDVITVELSADPEYQHNGMSASVEFYGTNVLPITLIEPTWS